MTGYEHREATRTSVETVDDRDATSDGNASTPDADGRSAEAFHARYDESDDRSLTVRVAEAVATVLDRDAESMTPLYAVIDPDSLDALLSASPGSDVELAFTYEGCRVTVSSQGDVVVQRGS